MKTSKFVNLLISASTLTASAAQMSDSFNDRPQVTGASETLTADTSFATTEAGETAEMHGSQRGRTVWAEWVAPASGWVTIDTAGSFANAVFAVYTGTSLDALDTVARGTYVSTQTPASARFPVNAGTAYQIVLDGVSYSKSSSGLGQVNVRLTPSETPLSATGTDRFADRPVLSGFQAYGVANNTMATLDPFQPETTGAPGKDVWWEWTAPATGSVTIDTLASPTDTVLTVFAGVPENDPPFSELDMVAQNNDVPNSKSSQVIFQTEAGRTYQIAASGASYASLARGNIIVKLNLTANTRPPAVPGTDFFIHRPDLEGTTAAGVACNTYHTVEAFEQTPYGDGKHSTWWQWVAPESCMMEIDTLGSAIDTMLRIYQGSDLETLAEVSFNDNAPGATWSKLQLRAIKGESYQIRVDSRGYSANNRGNIVLNLKRVPEAEIGIQQPVGSELADGKTRKSLGTTKVGATGRTMVFTIRNTGSAALTGLATGASGSQASDFIVGRPAKTTLAPGGSTTFAVTFKPKAKGSRTTILRIFSNDADENPFDIILSGTGSKN